MMPARFFEAARAALHGFDELQEIVMTQNATPSRRQAKKSSLAASAAAVTKKIIGAVLDKPETVKLPQAVSEIHVSRDEIIPAGTIITDEIAVEAGLDEDELADLEDAGHIKMVDVYAMAAAPAAEA